MNAQTEGTEGRGFINHYESWTQANYAVQYFQKNGFFAVQCGNSVVCFAREKWNT